MLDCLNEDFYSLEADYRQLQERHAKLIKSVVSVCKDYGSDDEGCTANLILNAIKEYLK